MTLVTAAPRSPKDATPAIAAWLAGALGAGSAEIERLGLLGGGAIQENWALDLALGDGTRQELVLRTDAPTRIALSWDRAQEYRVLEAAWRAGVTVPEPVALCEDPTVLGRPFQVMRRVAGEARGPRLMRDPAVLAGGDALASRLGRELAILHRLAPPVAGLGFMPVPDGPPALARVAEYRARLDALDAAEPVLEWALAWLERRAPPRGRVCLLHADFRTGNYLVADGRLAAVLDWEFAAFGDPQEDLGWMLMRAWRFGNDARECGGVGSREAFLSGYEEAAGHPVACGLVPYWEVMGTVRWAVIALMQAHRHRGGGQASLELALTGHVVPVLERDLLDYLAAARAAEGPP
jgi:aminoglycoside phosphotransferase (APT) family kinase protein